MQYKISLLLLIFVAIFSQATHAVEMESPNYRLELETVEEVPSEEQAMNEETRVLPENLYNQFQANGFVVLTDVEDMNNEITFNLSKIAASFENSKPLTTDGINIVVSATRPFGYEIQMLKNKPVSHTSTLDSIPQTQCDKNCTPRVAKPWEQESQYGIGYNLTGQDIPTDFVNSGYYRQLPESEPITVMKNAFAPEQREGKMTFQLNFDSTQPEGTYEGIYELRMVPKI